MFSFFAALRFDRNVAIFAFNCFAAAMLALFVGFSIGLPRPYWAMSTALIVSHPLSGAVRSKAIYRLFGTLLGAAVAIFLVPPLVDSPVLLSLAVSMWIGACLFVSLLDRTPRSYLMMLAGYTAAIIAFPSVNSPGNIFDIAVAPNKPVPRLPHRIIAGWFAIDQRRQSEPPSHARPRPVFRACHQTRRDRIHVGVADRAAQLSVVAHVAIKAAAILPESRASRALDL